jgi:hypothetical protein
VSNSQPTRPVFNIDEDPDNANWLRTWAHMPGTLEGLRAWLKQRQISPQAFKQSARYQANVGRFPWLKEL